MGFSTGLYSAITGLKNSQTALAVTAQNVSNSATTGYTRQQLIQSSSSYVTVGSCATGSYKLQIGLGSNASFIRQIRDKFFDASYREENSIGNYYAVKYVTGQEINNILGELESGYSLQGTFEEIYQALNDLISDPAAIETRTNFIQTCVTFLDKAQTISNSLYEYQMNLNGQIIDQVNSINSIVEEISELNTTINAIEADGFTRANDLRDQRNNLIDELSSYIGIEVKEVSVCDGNSTRIDILVNGNPILTNGAQLTLGVQYINGDYPFVEPVFTTSQTILPCSEDTIKLYPNLSSEDLSYLSSSTSGTLKALLVCRGDCIGNYSMSDEEVGSYLISNLQKELDTLVNTIVTIINDAFTNEGAYNLYGEQLATEVFVRVPDYDTDIAEDPNDVSTLYTINNIKINPELLTSEGYNLLALSLSGGESDTTILEGLVKDWKSSLDSLDGYNIDGYYKKIISDLAIEINAAQANYETQATLTSSLDNKRLSISGVSLDEELSDMLRFQYAYNAAAKIVGVIDDMVERVINY